MTNRELKEYIDSLSDADKLIIKRIVQMIREVMNRCTGLSTDINSISDDIQQLQLQLPSDSTTDTVSQVQSIQDFLIDNQSINSAHARTDAGVLERRQAERT